MCQALASVLASIDMWLSAGIDMSKENQDPGNAVSKLQRQSVDNWSNVDLSSEHDCNLNRATFKPIPENQSQARDSLLSTLPPLSGFA